MATPLHIALVLLLLSGNLQAMTISGTVTYDKTVYAKSGSATTTSTAVEGATITATGGSNSATYTATTAADGTYSMDIGVNTSYSINIQTSGSGVLVGSSVSGTTVVNPHTVNLVAGFTSSATLSTNLSGTNAEAFNVFVQLLRGLNWAKGQGLNTTRTVFGLYPSTTQGTQFNPTDFYLIVQKLSNDPDGFDDDIILHEFGHWMAEEFFKDSSQGGTHTITQSVDIRLSYSEGLAHYLSSAIRNNAQHLDFNSIGVNSFNISQPGSAKGAEVEMAVANALWQASNNGASHATVVATLQSMKSQLSTKSFASDPVSMDTFYDMWSGSSISTIYTDRGMSYFLDSIASNSSANPLAITSKSNYALASLSFFPEGNKDYFSFSALSGDVYSIKTAATANGALTSLRIYRDSIGASTLVASNDQANNSIGDNTSSLNLSVNQAGTYIAEVSRFNSTTRNYGLGFNDGYTRTAGRYGTYTFQLNQTTVGSSGGSSGSSSTTPGSSTTSTEGATILQGIVKSDGSTNLDSLAAFTATVSSAGESKTFTSSDALVSVKMASSGDAQITHSDSAQPLVLANIPSGHTVALATLPASSVSSLPTGATGKIISIDMKNGSTTVSSGFQIQLKLGSAYKANKTQKFHRRGSDGTFADSGYPIENNGKDLVINMTSFSTYVLVESDPPATTSSGGGGGGCLLGIKP